MKILYIYDKAPDTYSNYLVVLLRNLQKKLNIKVLTYGDNLQGDYNVKTYGLLDKFQRALFNASLSKYKSLDLKIMNQFDIVHIQLSYLRSKIIPLLDQKTRPKIVVTLRGGDTYLKPWASENWRNFYKESENNIDAFITMSEHQKNYLKKWGVNERKIHVIPISFGNYSNAQPKYPNQNTLKLVSAFRMTWEKNIEGSMRYAKSLKEKGINFMYDIYGDGNDIGQLYFLIDKFDLGSNVNVKGKVDNYILKEKLIEYDFFVQLSISEALPASILEAQSKGIPCIISNSGGLPEAVIPNESAIVGDYNQTEYFVEESLRIWQNKDLYFSFSDKAIRNVNENFSIEKETERLIKLYHNLDYDAQSSLIIN